MARSKWKSIITNKTFFSFFYQKKKLSDHFDLQNIASKQPTIFNFKTDQRHLMVLSSNENFFKTFKFQIYTGNRYIPITILYKNDNEKKVIFFKKLGEFVYTRKAVIHARKNQDLKKNTKNKK